MERLAFEQPELSPRELATRFTDTNSYYVSESSVYRLLKAHDLIGSPAIIVIKADPERPRCQIPGHKRGAGIEFSCASAKDQLRRDRANP
jgi:hypothetical protein